MVGHDLYHNRLELHLQLAVGRYMIGLTGGHQRKRVKKKTKHGCQRHDVYRSAAHEAYKFTHR